MGILLYIILSTLLISLISLIGIFFLSVKEDLLKRILIILVAFSAGTLIAGAFFHLLPESLEHLKADRAFLYVIIGFTSFFFLERAFYWHHCRSGICNEHAFTYLNLFGDALHNFIDGILIAGSFMSGISIGIVTTLAVAFHELPQEISDFAVLLYGGFSKSKALIYNLLFSLTAVAGGIIGYFLSSKINGFSVFLLSFTAGGFIYIAATDLIPEIHKEKSSPKGSYAFIVFVLGLFFIWIIKKTLH
jgi:zinc and cadmium transporter